MAERLRVDEPGTLLAFLEQRLPGWRRRTLKSRLRSGCLRVNGESATRHDHPLRPGDEVEVGSEDEPAARLRRSAPFATLHLDEDLVAIDKPAGLLSVGTQRERTKTALSLLKEALSRPRHPAGLWPVHRLDRETSGVLLFARSREMRDAVQADWSRVEKIYQAVVEGRPEPPQGLIDEPLHEDRSLEVRSGPHPEARDARTHYATLRSGRQRSLLTIRLETGRRHQIRVHLMGIGHPVVGDSRYGVRGPRLGLHALRLRLLHPRDLRPLSLSAPPPPEFTALL